MICLICVQNYTKKYGDKTVVNDISFTAKDGAITVEYNDSICKYTFLGMPYEYGVFFNRNGRYKVFRLSQE